MNYIKLNDSDEYNIFTNNGNDLIAGDIYLVENPSECHFKTNNIEGDTIYNFADIDTVKSIIDGTLVSIEIPIGTKKIAEYRFCRSDLESVTIPNTVTIIELAAFGFCEHLPSVTIPSSVTSIGNNAFRSCTNLNTVIMEGTTPPTIGTDVFKSTANNLKIYVPSDSVTAYKSANNWSNYANNIYSIE